MDADPMIKRVARVLSDGRRCDGTPPCSYCEDALDRNSDDAAGCMALARAAIAAMRARTVETIYRCEYGEYVLPYGVDADEYLAEQRERIHAELKQRARGIPGAYVEPDIERNS
jgi:hypothetical protein